MADNTNPRARVNRLRGKKRVNVGRIGRVMRPLMKRVAQEEFPIKHFQCCSGGGLTASASSGSTTSSPYVHNVWQGLQALVLQSSLSGAQVPARYLRSSNEIFVESIKMNIEFQNNPVAGDFTTGGTVYLRMALIKHRLSNNPSSIGTSIQNVPTTTDGIPNQELFLDNTMSFNPLVAIFDPMKVSVLKEWNLETQPSTYLDNTASTGKPGLMCKHYYINIPIKKKFTFRDPASTYTGTFSYQDSKWNTLFFVYWFEAPGNGQTNVAKLFQSWDIVFRDCK